MSVARRWMDSADRVYGGEDEAAVFERATRLQGDVDRVVIEYLILQELIAIRRQLEHRDSRR